MFPVASARGVQPRIPEVEEDGFADTERVYLLHHLLHLRRWFLLFTFASRLLGGEVDRHRPGVAVVTPRDGAQDVGPELLPVGWIIRHQLARAVRIARTTLHDLHEADLRGSPGVSTSTEVLLWNTGSPVNSAVTNTGRAAPDEPMHASTDVAKPFTGSLARVRSVR